MPVRELPHSIEAEECLLSTCLIDAPDVIPRARNAGLTKHSFYDSKNAIIFACLCALFDAGRPVDIMTLAEELRSTKQLDQIGGYSFLTQITRQQPTTAQTSYFIEKVREHDLQRGVIRWATGLVEETNGFTGGLDEFHELIRERQQQVTALTAQGLSGRTYEMSLDSLLHFDPGKDADCLMGKRFLSRTGSLVIVAPSGVGKSVLSLQLGACAALGRPFFGLQMSFPLRVLYVQAEDDTGDVAEAVQGFVREYGINAADIEQLKQRLRIVRWNDAAGGKFLDRLRREHGKHPFDFVIANPLFSFCGCNVSDQEKMSTFLRNGLNPILNDTGAAAAIVHHTNKPPTDPKNQPGDADLSYAGSGSSELTNWARAYVTLQRVKSAGGSVYKMAFAKRGHRAGLVDDEGKPTMSVLIEHSPRGLCWVPSDYSINQGANGKFQAKFDLDRAKRVYDPDIGWADNEAAIATDQNASDRTVRRHKRLIEEYA